MHAKKFPFPLLYVVQQPFQIDARLASAVPLLNGMYLSVKQLSQGVWDGGLSVGENTTV